jgi:hypothetical protein
MNNWFIVMTKNNKKDVVDYFLKLNEEFGSLDITDKSRKQVVNFWNKSVGKCFIFDASNNIYVCDKETIKRSKTFRNVKEIFSLSEVKDDLIGKISQDVTETLHQLAYSINKQKEDMIYTKLKELGIDYKANANDRFPMITRTVQGDIEKYYYNDGTPDGKLFLTLKSDFTFKDSIGSNKFVVSVTAV